MNDFEDDLSTDEDIPEMSSTKKATKPTVTQHEPPPRSYGDFFNTKPVLLPRPPRGFK